MGSARLIPGLLLAALACQPLPFEPTRPEPAPNPDACAAACTRLAELGCAEADPNAAGTDCLTLCRAVESSGYVTLDPACVASLDACELERCTHEAQ